MAVDFPEQREKVFARYPFLCSTLFERRMLFGAPTNSRRHRCSRPLPFEGAARLTEISA